MTAARLAPAASAEAAAARRAAAFACAALVVDVAGGRALDALGLVESLLAPGGARAALVVPLALLFYAARLALLFVAPGWLCLALARLAAAVLRDRRARSPSKPL